MSAGLTCANGVRHCRTSTSAMYCDARAGSTSPQRQRNLERSSAHSRTDCPSSDESWRARRQQTPMSPKLSTTEQKMSQVRAGKGRVVNGRAFYYVDAASMNAVVTRGNFARRLIACAVYEFAHLVMTRRRGRIDSDQPDAGAVQAFFGKARVAGLHRIQRCTLVDQYRGDDFEL